MKQSTIVPVFKPKGNVFDLSHERKMTIRMGNLYPTLVQEIVPGDKFQVKAETFMRFAPMLAPIMHRVNVYTHYFFVPNRLLWDSWEDFITGGREGDDTSQFPTIQLGDVNKTLFAKGTLADYLGVPPYDLNGASAITVQNYISALPFRAYQKIYNDYYRDQNLQDEVPIETGSTTSNLANLCTIRGRCWEKDYFTSALPWAQRGTPVNIPIAMDVQYKNASTVHATNGTFPQSGGLGISSTTQGQTLKGAQTTLGSGGVDTRIENIDQLVSSGTIEDLRTANRIQQWLEKQARGGARYIETILNHFGVQGKDFRLQRAEYLGGGKQPAVISEVLQAYGDKTETYTGEYTGHGISVGQHFGFKHKFVEHGFLIGILSVLPKTAYSQGLERHWFKTDKFDYYWPEFAHLGDQAIQNKELFLQYDGTSVNSGTFGYQTRYSEYKFKESTFHGDFRDNMSFWHMGRIWTGNTPPVLDALFTQASPSERIFAVTDPTVDKLFVQIYNNVKAIRPMPVFTKPSL